MKEEDNMTETSFEQVSLEETNIGDVINGTIINVKEDEAILNIGSLEAEGIIRKHEMVSQYDYVIGETLQVKVISKHIEEGKIYVAHRKLLVEAGLKVLEEAYENQTVLTSKVNEITKGGLITYYERNRVFIPASLISDKYIKDFSSYQGKEVSYVISEFNVSGHRIIGDCKQVIIADQEAKKQAALDKLSMGDRVEGRVKKITSFGAFVDLGGIDGLLHISEMSWGQLDDIKSIMKVGDQIKVLIKNIQGDKISLSLKFSEDDPWNTAKDKYAIGTNVDGKVARMTSYGAFIELEPGIDGLLHVSQISNEYVESPADKLSVGDEITAKVIDFDEIKHKISLSMKAV